VKFVASRLRIKYQIIGTMLIFFRADRKNELG
jgi:hypothetical protein